MSKSYEIKDYLTKLVVYSRIDSLFNHYQVVIKISIWVADIISIKW